MTNEEITLRQMLEKEYISEEPRVLLKEGRAKSWLPLAGESKGSGGTACGDRRVCDLEPLSFQPVRKPGETLSDQAFLGTAQVVGEEIICREWLASGTPSLKWDSDGAITDDGTGAVRLEDIQKIKMVLCAVYKFAIGEGDQGKCVSQQEVYRNLTEYKKLRVRGYKCRNHVAYKGLMLIEKENTRSFFGLYRAARRLLGDIVLTKTGFDQTTEEHLQEKDIRFITPEDAVPDLPPVPEEVQVPRSLTRWVTLAEIPAEEKCVVLRFFQRKNAGRYTHDGSGDLVYELCRIYVRKERVKTYISNGTVWAETDPVPASAVSYYPVYFNGNYKELVRGTKLEYAGSLVGNPEHSMDNNYFLIGVLYNERFEKLAKAGLLYAEKDKDYDAFMYDQFGILGKGNPCQITGMNRHQLDQVKSCIGRHRYELRRIGWTDAIRTENMRRQETGLFRIFKEILYVDPEHRPFGGPETYMNVAACPNNAADAVVHLLDAYLDYQNPRSIQHLADLMHYVVTEYSVDALIRWEEGLTQIIRNSPYHNQGLFYDMRKLLRDLDEIRECTDLDRPEPRFASYEELKNAHDAAAELAGSIRTRGFQEGFRKNYASWQKFEYREGQFLVMAPKEPQEIIHEGITLHHCVKGFVPSVAQGRTNIVFIRKPADPETPFFTVEISNEGQLVQVHGMCNRNTDTEPGLDAFIGRWCKARELSRGNINRMYGAR